MEGRGTGTADAAREVAAPVAGFVGFAIGRSIWEDAIAAHRRGSITDAETIDAISGEYVRYSYLYSAPAAGGRHDRR